MPRVPNRTLEYFLFTEYAEQLDRFESLLAEDQALRAAEYEHPDPSRRRLRVACNECTTPWCCNQRVDVDLVEALVIYRWAAKNAPAQLEQAVARGKELHERRKPLADLDEFFRRRVSCPFLVKGRCSIYPVRPHPCRTHYMAGNALKCRDELAPSETYAMDPDPTVIADVRQVADDLKFFALVGEVELTELAELLSFIERLAKTPKWRKPRTLGWRAIEKPAG